MPQPTAKGSWFGTLYVAALMIVLIVGVAVVATGKSKSKVMLMGAIVLALALILIVAGLCKILLENRARWAAWKAVIQGTREGVERRRQAGTSYLYVMSDRHMDISERRNASTRPSMTTSSSTVTTHSSSRAPNIPAAARPGSTVSGTRSTLGSRQTPTAGAQMPHQPTIRIRPMIRGLMPDREMKTATRCVQEMLCQSMTLSQHPRNLQDLVEIILHDRNSLCMESFIFSISQSVKKVLETIYFNRPESQCDPGLKDRLLPVLQSYLDTRCPRIGSDVVMLGERIWMTDDDARNIMRKIESVLATYTPDLQAPNINILASKVTMRLRTSRILNQEAIKFLQIFLPNNETNFEGNLCKKLYKHVYIKLFIYLRFTNPDLVVDTPPASAPPAEEESPPPYSFALESREPSSVVVNSNPSVPDELPPSYEEVLQYNS